MVDVDYVYVARYFRYNKETGYGSLETIIHINPEDAAEDIAIRAVDAEIEYWERAAVDGDLLNNGAEYVAEAFEPYEDLEEWTSSKTPDREEWWYTKVHTDEKMLGQLDIRKKRVNTGTNQNGDDG